MRTTLFLALAALVSVAGHALADSKPVALSASDVTTQLKVVQDEVQHCYLDRAAAIRGAGKLELTLAISKHGALDNVTVATPGLSQKLSKQIGACVKTALDGLAFADAHTSTTATVPYFFQHTAAPGAGPQRSCYSAEGCR